MIQQWEYRTVQVNGPTEKKVNAVLAAWSADGWELVNGSYGSWREYPADVWLFWRRAK